MAAALERQTRLQEIRTVCVKAMQDPIGTGIQKGTQTYTHINTLNVLTIINN